MKKEINKELQEVLDSIKDWEVPEGDDCSIISFKNEEFPDKKNNNIFFYSENC